MHVTTLPVEVVAERGLRQRLGVFAPVLALAVVVGAALAGGAGGDAAFSAAVAPRSALAADATTGVGGAGQTVLVPRRVLGLPVRTGPELAAARAAGQVRDGAVAVAGVMRSDPLPLVCGSIRQTLSRDFCLRLVALFPLAPDAGPAASAAGARGPDRPEALEGIVAPGVALPAVAASQSELAPWLTVAVPVVFVGHYQDERAPPCPRTRGWCSGDLVLERLVWAAGAVVPVGLSRDPAVTEAEVPPDGHAWREVAGWLERAGLVVLSSTVVRGPQLQVALDAQAGARPALRTGAIWWYVRALAPATLGREARVTWAVFDALSGEFLAASD